ncbi:MAG: hypothetical protein HETSPECPRED_009343 [Heterodermia speciosa]|uniref:Cytochrome P450 n=1 Tax=Heterodermia speciosa TaxID=116794 RepID=A0A8H3IZB0_9LECA|nr:MAG: hypothetical protein HETSPECPRED_009343 [Heterodermia speciosa]
MATKILEMNGSDPRLLLGGLVLGSLFYVIALRLRTYAARRKIILQHGCKPPSKYPVWDPFFGVDVIYDAIRAVKRKTFMSEKTSHYNTYGNTHSSRLTTFPVISTIEPENIKTVLSTNFKDFVIGTPRQRAFGPVIANSLLVADGIEWEHSRAFLKPSFARSQVGDLATLETHVKNLIEAVPRDGLTVDMAELFLRYTADVTTDFMFGESIFSLPHPEAFGGALAEACRIGQLGVERRFRLGIFADFVPQRPFYRAVKEVHTYMEAHVGRAIQQRHLQTDNEKDRPKDAGKYVFLNELAKLTDDRLVLRDQLLGIFLAGRDTTATLLANMFFVLAREPEVWKRLQEEISSLNGRKPTLDELKGLKYLGFCLNETLRLYPIIQGSSRVALKDIILPQGGGDDGKSPVFVAAGTLVIFHFMSLHRRKDLWGDDADEFRPERWQDEKASWNFLPFGGGPRNCIGQQFALTEASYTVVRLLQEFSGIESRDAQPWTESVGVTCTSANGAKIAMVAR